ncbi:unnamed protein product [Arctogadus glacialis]
MKTKHTETLREAVQPGEGHGYKAGSVDDEWRRMTSHGEACGCDTTNGSVSCWGPRGHGGAGCQSSTRVWEHQMLAVAASHWGRNTVAPWGPGFHDVTGDNSAECMEVRGGG